MLSAYKPHQPRGVNSLIVHGQVDNTRVPPAREYHSATKRREALTLATTETNPEDKMLSERSRHRRTHRV